MPSSFSIQAAARRTGLSAHVIRAWERRYQAIEPERSSGKHRLYSDSEIERLALLHRAVEMGHGIGKIARLSKEELLALTAHAPGPAPAVEIKAGGPVAGALARSLEAVEQFDAATLEALLQSMLLTHGHNGFLRLFIAPLAEEIGERWRQGLLTAAHEHFFTACAKAFLGELVRRQYSTPLGAPRIVVGTTSGQLHELGALMAASTAANLGWQPVYLGPSLPVHEIAGAALRNEAAAIALSIIYPEDDPNLSRDLTELVSLLPASTRVFVGGRAAAGYVDTLKRIGAVHIVSLEEFADQLDALRRRADR